MYKGNMYEFVEKVSAYMQKHFGRKVRITTQYEYERVDRIDGKGGWFKRKPNSLSYRLFISSAIDSNWYSGSAIYDREDFEKQVYDIIKREIEGKSSTTETWFQD